MSESSDISVDGKPIVEKSDSSDIIDESSDSLDQSVPNTQQQVVDTQTESLNDPSPSLDDSPTTSHNQESKARHSECGEDGEVRATSPESSESVGSSVRVEDVTLREKSPTDRDRPKLHPLSIDTSDSETSVPRYSPGLYTSGKPNE